MSEDHNHHSHQHAHEHDSSQEGSCCGVSRRNFLQTTALITGAAIMPGTLLAQTSKGTAAGKRVDTHFYFYPPEISTELGSGARNWSLQKAMDHMGQNGVASGVFSLSSPPDKWWQTGDEEMRKKVRLINDYAAKLVQDQPKKFGQFAFLSMNDVEGSLKEIEYAFDTLKADGIGISTNYGDKWPGDPKYAPIFEELNRRKAVVYFHPNAPSCCGNLEPGIGPSWIEYPHDTTRAAISLLFNGTLVKNRDIKFLFSHGGGTIPMLVGRLVNSTKDVKNLKEVAPNGIPAEFQRFYFDTAQAHSPGAMAAILKLTTVSKLVFGSDFPYYTEDDTVNGLEKHGFKTAELNKIYYENAYGLVPRLKA